MWNDVLIEFKKAAKWLLCVIVIAIVPAKAMASCTETPTAVTKVLSSPASITINPYVAVGTVLNTSTFTGNSGSFTITCTTNFSEFTYQGVGTATNNIYPTNIPGIGIQLSNATGTTGNWPVTETIAAVKTYTATASVATNFSLIKTGPITANGTLPINVGNFVLPQQGNFVGFQINLASPMLINFTKPSCSVTSPTIAVSLGAFPVSHFPAVGSKSSPIPFTIQVTCVDGPTGSSTQMSVTLTDASGTDVGNTSNTLSLSSTSTAAGIGVQIEYNGTVESYGPDSSVAGNTNQFLLGTGANGVFNFPFYAYMIRTGTVKAGSVITTATFTMSYQ
jgi:type 1 fimbria pilin